MWLSTHLFVQLLVGSALQQTAVGHVVRAACDVPSAYSVLSKASTGSAFCSSLLYPGGPSTATVTVTAVSTKPCKTVTATETEETSKTITKTQTSILPTTTVKEYTATVLVPSGSHQPVNKREAQASMSSMITPTPTTVSSAAAGVATPQQCSPTPSQLCTCPSNSISAACSSLIPSSKTITLTETDTSTVKCSKTDVTITTTIKEKTTTTYTFTVYPAPDLIYKTKTLTTTVPAACATMGYYGSGGSNFIILSYPYFPQTAVECCVLCYDTAFPNCVASGFIAGALECQLLLRDNTTAGTSPSSQCPYGIENYDFGQPESDGNVFPGPCGY